MNPLAVFKPEYLYRPSQLVRRISAAFSSSADTHREVELSFGGVIRVWNHDVIGRALIHLGVYDLGVSEVLWRLTGSGEFVIDIGANIGYFTRLLGSRVGADGTVLAFEPHPVLFEELRANIELCRSKSAPTWDLRRVASSSSTGLVPFVVPVEFSSNRGVCRVETATEASYGLDVMQVESCRLDDIISPEVRVGVVKMDVEGHEASVLAGADRVLATHQVRDWVFEDLTESSDITHIFEDCGYEVFLIERRMNQPRLTRRNSASLSGRWEPPSFLATIDPGRALRLLSQNGWSVLNSSAPIVL